MKENIWIGYLSLKNMGKWIIILIFTVYIMYLVNQASSLSTKIFLLIFGLFVITISIYYEYLKTIYEEMIQALTAETSISLALLKKMKLQKKDIFHGFDHSLILFDSLLLLDQGHYQDCLKHMKKHDQFFHSQVDYLFIYYHNLLHCYYFLGKEHEALHVIQKLDEFRKIKKNKLSPLFSWDEIDGIRFYLNHRMKKSIDSFKRINQNHLNNREKTYLNFMLAQSYRGLGDTNKVGIYMGFAKKYGNEITIARRKTFEKIE